MMELFVISLLGLVAGVTMIWIANREKEARIEVLQHENEILRQELKREMSDRR